MLRAFGDARTAFANAFAVLLGLGTLVFWPLGFGRAGIWIEPKLSVQAIAVIPLLLLLRVLLTGGAVQTNAKDCRPQLGRAWWTGVLLWVSSAIIVATSLSADPVRALVGFHASPEGALFYVGLVAIGTLVAWLAGRNPYLLKAIGTAVVCVATITSLMAVPQKFDWTMDYTVTSGQLSAGSRGAATVAGVWRGQAPNGPFWHRGFVGYVCALGLTVAMSAFIRGERFFGRREYAAIGITLSAVGVAVGDTRAAYLAAMLGAATAAAVVYDRSASRRRRVIAAIAACGAGVLVGVVLSALGESRFGQPSATVAAPLSNEASDTRVPVTGLISSSGRDFVWRVAWEGIGEHWLIGSGFMANQAQQGRVLVEHAILNGELARDSVVEVVSSEFIVTARLADGTLWSRFLVGSKPHNLFLEMLQSTGLIGFTGFIALLCLIVVTVARSRTVRWVLGPMVTWAVFMFFWFESVQYSMLHWSLFAAAVGVAQREHSG